MATLLGALILLVGIILLIGNISGLWPSFPLAGFLTMSLGSFILKTADNNR
ncbi:MAG: hypothetical protein ABIQ88_23810 [Chitinophagaceae bacterium]